ncbi:ketopantoate reductase family protein [Paenibacillus sp. 1011MAR3C5]|uniref:ketopantoate reductase family protein n=1 Tax=Paenibacillus sp. 1011MAR3C5 TaxID=1675787 RepID=UPI001601C291|nr:2-dehydropantoate 2-reductase [Paenibacillus sp. 1011MAR3C5]
MQIEVVGGGAIGLWTAAKLASAGARVRLWTRTERQSFFIVEAGIRLVDTEGNSRTVRLACEPMERHRLAQAPKDEDDCWIILAVKQTAINDELIGQLRVLAQVHRHTAVLCLQNGIGHLGKLAAALGGVPVYAAVTTMGAKREDERTVRLAGMGELWIGETAENCPKMDEIRAKSQKKFLLSLQKAGFRAFLSNQINNRIFHKLLINAVINPLTAIYDVTNGELPKQERRIHIMRALHNETLEILKRAGMQDSGDSWEQVLDVCERTSANVSSMLADVRASRETEIRAINGAVAELAASLGLTAPLNEAMAAIVESFEQKQ